MNSPKQSMRVSFAPHPHQYMLFLVFLIVAILTQGFPGGSAGNESACNAGELGLIPGLGRSSREGKGYPL